MYSNFKNLESVSKQARKPMWKAALSKRSSATQTQPDHQSLRTRFVILRLRKKKGLLRSDHCKNSDSTCTSTVHFSADEQGRAKPSISSSDKTSYLRDPHDTLENCLVPVYPDPVCAEASYPKAGESSAMASSSASEPVHAEGGSHSSKRTRDGFSIDCSYTKRTKTADGSARIVAACTPNQTLSALDNNIPAYPEHVAMNGNSESPEPITMPVYPSPVGTEANYPKAEESVLMKNVVDGIAQFVARAGSANLSTHGAFENNSPAHPQPVEMNANIETKTITTPVQSGPVGTKANEPEPEESDTTDSSVVYLGQRWVPEARSILEEQHPSVPWTGRQHMARLARR